MKFTSYSIKKYKNKGFKIYLNNELYKNNDSLNNIKKIEIFSSIKEIKIIKLI